MRSIEHYYLSVKSRLRDYTNPYLGSLRRKRLSRTDITIISNNCWGAHCYRYFQLPYDSPTIGLYMYPDDYIRFIKDLKHYMNMELRFIPYTESVHKEELIKKGQTNVPIGVLDDVEIVFLHFHSEKEAAEKWERRKKRIHWDNIYYKFSQMNDCEYRHLKAFDELPTKKKFMFTAKEYPEFSSAVFFNVGEGKENQIQNDTMAFNPNINLVRFFNGNT